MGIDGIEMLHSWTLIPSKSLVGRSPGSDLRWLHSVEPVVIATFQLTLASLVLLPLALFGPHPTALHWKSMAAVTVLGVLGSGLAYLLFFRLLATISPTRTVAVTYLLPIWGLFWGFIAGDQIHWTALAGVAVVLGGLVLLNLRSRPEKPDDAKQSVPYSSAVCAAVRSSTCKM